MKKYNVKRLIKSKISSASNGLSFTSITGSICILTVLLFCIIQLGINATLNPKGEKLESLNQEKKMLIEENRQIEEEIAEAKSYIVISDIATKKLSLDNSNSQQIYIKDTSLVATK